MLNSGPEVGSGQLAPEKRNRRERRGYSETLSLEQGVVGLIIAILPTIIQN